MRFWKWIRGLLEELVKPENIAKTMYTVASTILGGLFVVYILAPIFFGQPNIELICKKTVGNGGAKLIEATLKNTGTKAAEHVFVQVASSMPHLAFSASHAESWTFHYEYPRMFCENECFKPCFDKCFKIPNFETEGICKEKCFNDCRCQPHLLASDENGNRRYVFPHLKERWHTGREFTLTYPSGTEVKAIVGGDGFPSSIKDCVGSK